MEGLMETRWTEMEGLMETRWTEMEAGLIQSGIIEVKHLEKRLMEEGLKKVRLRQE